MIRCAFLQQHRLRPNDSPYKYRTTQYAIPDQFVPSYIYIAKHNCS